MSMEMNPNQNEGLPEEVVIEKEGFLTDEGGKKFKYEKDGIKYGGDYQDELPEEVDIDLPPPPTEENSVI